MVTARHSLLSSIVFCIILVSLFLGTLAGFSGPASFFGFLVILLQLRMGAWKTSQIKTVTMAFILGGAWEGIVVHQEWIIYQGTTGYHALPWWMLIFWMAIGNLINGALSGLKGHVFRSMLLGACFGPLFAMAGEQIGILSLTDTALSLKALSIGWAAIFGFLASLTVRYSRDDMHPS